MDPSNAGALSRLGFYIFKDRVFSLLPSIEQCRKMMQTNRNAFCTDFNIAHPIPRTIWHKLQSV